MTESAPGFRPDFSTGTVAKVRQILGTIERTVGAEITLLDSSGRPADFDGQGVFHTTSDAQRLSARSAELAREGAKPVLHSAPDGSSGVSVPFLSGGHIAGFVSASGIGFSRFDSAQTSAMKERLVFDESLPPNLAEPKDKAARLDFGRFSVLIDLLEAAAARIGTFVSASTIDGALHAISAPFAPEIAGTLQAPAREAGVAGHKESDDSARLRLEAMYDTTQEAILMFDKDMRIVTANKELGRIFGIDADAFVGVSSDWLERWMVKNAKNPAKVANMIEGLMANPNSSIEDEIEFLSPRYMILRFYSAPVTDRLNEVIGRLLVFKDITSFRKARYDLIGSEKMSLIGRVAAGMAHELNNILAGMMTYADYALESGDNDKIREALRMSVAAGEKASQLVGQFLAVAGPSESHRQDVELHAEMGKLLDMLEPVFSGDNIRIHRLLESVPRVNADPVQMQQAFHNILNNAREAIGKDGTISVRTETDWDRSNVRVIMTDSGPGIPVEYLDRVFDPFFTTKGVVAGGGSTGAKGLGLAMAKGVIEAHGGKIYAGNVLPRGASFIIELPIAGGEKKKHDAVSAY